MFLAKFTYHEGEVVSAKFTSAKPKAINAVFGSNLGIKDHNKLFNRDLPDQHPIDAITNLRDILNRLWTFTYEQGEPSTVWVVQHNLGRNPNWVVVDSAGSVQLPDKVTYNNDNQITFEFIGAFAGKVFLN